MEYIVAFDEKQLSLNKYTVFDSTNRTTINERSEQ